MEMVTDLLLQAAFIFFTVFMFLWMQNIPQKLLPKIRSLFVNQSAVDAKRHFVRGAQFLARARSARDSTVSADLARSAAEEADRAIASDPKDAAAHILKALALDLGGFKTSALDSIDVALSPLAVRSLSGEERGDALFKRAELKVGMSPEGRVDSAVKDLVDSVKLRSDNAKAFCLLGQCYETKGLGEEARKAYEEALRVEPKSSVARVALDRLGVTCKREVTPVKHKMQPCKALV